MGAYKDRSLRTRVFLRKTPTTASLPETDGRYAGRYAAFMPCKMRASLLTATNSRPDSYQAPTDQSPVLGSGWYGNGGKPNELSVRIIKR